MAPKEAQPAGPMRRSTRIASKEAVSYTPTVARVVKKSPVKKTPAKKSAAPKAAPVKKAAVKKSTAPKKAPAVKKALAPKPASAVKVTIPISTTPTYPVPSSSKLIKPPYATKKRAPSPKKSPHKISPAKASPKKSPKKVAVSGEVAEERIPTVAGLVSPKRLK